MTRTEVIESMANRTGMEKKEVKRFLEDLTMLIEETMVSPGFIRTGSFWVSFGSYQTRMPLS